MDNACWTANRKLAFNPRHVMACESPGNVRWWVLVDKDDWTAHSKLAYNSLIAERRLKNQIKISLLYIRPERHVSIPSKYCTVYTGLWIWIWICMDPQKLKNNNKKNARKLVKNCNCIHIFKVNLDQRHDFLLLSNLFCFFNYSNLVIFYKVFFTLDPDQPKNECGSTARPMTLYR